jgi:hypothetical protein
MYDLLLEIDEKVNKSKSGFLSPKKIKYYQKLYRTILSRGKKECPFAEKTEVKQGKTKKSKSRNLLPTFRRSEHVVILFINFLVIGRRRHF